MVIHAILSRELKVERGTWTTQPPLRDREFHQLHQSLVVPGDTGLVEEEFGPRNRVPAVAQDNSVILG